MCGKLAEALSSRVIPEVNFPCVEGFSQAKASAWRGAGGPPCPAAGEIDGCLMLPTSHSSKHGDLDTAPHIQC